MIEYKLSRGDHVLRENGMCAMEFAAFLAGEHHSSSPRCVSPLLRGVFIMINDNIVEDDRRQGLRPYVARAIGTANDGQDEARYFTCLDWFIRTDTPNRHPNALSLRKFPEIVNIENLNQVLRFLGEDSVFWRMADWHVVYNAATRMAYDELHAAAAAVNIARWSAASTAPFVLLDRLLPTVSIEVPSLEGVMQ